MALSSNLRFRYLLKNYMAAQQGQKTSGTVAYISERDTTRSDIRDDLSPNSLVTAFKHRAFRSDFFQEIPLVRVNCNAKVFNTGGVLNYNTTLAMRVSINTMPLLDQIFYLVGTYFT